MAVLTPNNVRKDASSSTRHPPAPTPKESRKRPQSEVPGPADGSKRPKKVVKLSGEERIQELEAQVRELHSFILDLGVADDAPVSILDQLEGCPGFEKILSDSLKKRIHATWEPLFHETFLGKETSTTADTVSKAVCKYIPEIERLSRMPDGLKLAFQLIFFFGQHSYGCAENLGLSKWDRPSDPLADNLLVDILRRMKAKDPSFKPQDEFLDLKQEAKKFHNRGYKQHFRRSLSLMWSWLKPKDTPQ